MTGWRYACPRGHRQVKRVGGETVHGADQPRTWVCRQCQHRDDIETCHFKTVTDLKTGAEVSV